MSPTITVYGVGAALLIAERQGVFRSDRDDLCDGEGGGCKEEESEAVLRTIDLGGAISSGPAVVNGIVVVGAGTGGFGTATKQGVYGLVLGPTPLETSTTTTTTSTTSTT